VALGQQDERPTGYTGINVFMAKRLTGLVSLGIDHAMEDHQLLVLCDME
jgi:hypothetical protein